ncbi:MAG: DNA replication and repair protein RecF [Flavobacteriales bacterium]|nr:DNA replication and repair protein RecF [Flavobacteriales bacterium]MCX7651020.1 DNA replication and repair protein RecF [Flavobacteriales bacterium]MDW8432398.1 DNA replication and repair protein RecF [Flavobacteriales bacterium]
MAFENLWSEVSGFPAVTLEKLEIWNFRNHRHTAVNFQSWAHCITGPNGSGKSALLEAISYLCTGRGFASGQDQNYVMLGHEQEGFELHGHFRLDTLPFKIECTYKSGVGKEFRFNGKLYGKLSDHLGRLPAVAIYPADIEMVWGYAADRRKYLDQILSFSDPNYLNVLKRYYKFLELRNAHLRQAKEARRSPDPVLLEAYAEEMGAATEILNELRSRYVSHINEKLILFYEVLAHNNEYPYLEWHPSAPETEKFRHELVTAYEADLRVGSTLRGPHKDEVEFRLHGQPLKKHGSQGQQKTYLIALKLAAIHMLSVKLNRKPLILLDDIFDKLDPRRVESLLQLLAEFKGQLFISDTEPGRLFSVKGVPDMNFHIFECDAGNLRVARRTISHV